MVNRRLGKRRRHAISWIHATGRGKIAGGAGPPEENHSPWEAERMDERELQ